MEDGASRCGEFAAGGTLLRTELRGTVAAAVRREEFCGGRVRSYSLPWTEAPHQHVAAWFVAVEFQGAVEQVGKAASVTTGGGMRELVLSTGLEQLYFRRIDEELSLFAVLDRDGIVGKLRYLAAQLESQLKAAL